MMNFQDKLDSKDKRERSEALDIIAGDTKLPQEKKIEYFLKGLNDPHDLVRSKAVNLLSEIKDEKIFDKLIERLLKEPFWGTRFLILRKLTENVQFWQTNKNIKNLAKFIHDPKPKVRIQAAYLLGSEQIGDFNTIYEIFFDKDPDVRREVENLLENSSDPGIRKKIEDYKRKLNEKESKKKQVESMFDGI